MGKRVLALGSSFGGYHSAVALRKLLGREHTISVISSEDVFTFIPSLPWVLMGWRAPERIQFPVAESLRRKGIDFVQDTIVRADPDNNRVLGKNGEYDYDYLVAATGSELDFGAVPGLGPGEGHSHYGKPSLRPAGRSFRMVNGDNRSRAHTHIFLTSISYFFIRYRSWRSEMPRY